MFNTYKRSDQKLKIIISGNNFNEKISEKLTSNNRIKKTEINKIFCIKDKFPEKIIFNNYYRKIIKLIIMVLLQDFF